MKKIVSLILVISIVVTAFSMVAFASTAPNIIIDHHFTTGTHGWYAFESDEGLIHTSGYIGAKNCNKTWASPAVDIYDEIKAAGVGTYVVNMRVYHTDTSQGIANARMLLRTNRETSFSEYSDERNCFGVIGVEMMFNTGEWVNMSGSFKVVESDIEDSSGSFILCFDNLSFGTYNSILYVDSVTICKLNEDNITNGNFEYDEVGWRNWGGEGNFSVEFDSLSMLYFGRYVKASTYGSIATNVDQIIAKHGCTEYDLTFKIRVEDEAYDNLGRIVFYLSKNNSDYHYWIDSAGKSAFRDGHWLTFTTTIDMNTKVDGNKSLYEMLTPNNDQVFLRYEYRDADDAYFEDECYYSIADVSFNVKPNVTKVILEETWKEVEIGWSGSIGYDVVGDNHNNGVYWYSTDTSVATVNRNTGLIQAKNPGVTFIYATSNNNATKYSSCVVKVFHSDPFHHTNIQRVKFTRIQDNEWFGFGAETDHTVAIIKSKLNAFDYCVVQNNINNVRKQCVLTATLKNKLDDLEEQYNIFSDRDDVKIVHAAKKETDQLVQKGYFSYNSSEYYGVWTINCMEEINILNGIEQAVNYATLAYNIYLTIMSTYCSYMKYVGTSQYSLISAQYQSNVEMLDELDNAVLGLKYNNKTVISAEERNSILTSKGYNNPYKAETSVYKILTTEVSDTRFVRVYATESNRIGSWIMKYSDMQGLTPTQIQNKFALPSKPTHYCFVNIPAGANICVGYTGSQNFSGIYYEGGGIQYELIEFIDNSCFGQSIPLE